MEYRWPIGGTQRAAKAATREGSLEQLKRTLRALERKLVTLIGVHLAAFQMLRFTGRTTVAAWRDKPSWYAISKNDNTTSPGLQRFLASRMKARVVEIDSGHLSLVSHAKEIAELILVVANHR